MTMMRLANRNTTFMSCSMNSTVMSCDRPAIAANSSALSSLRHAGRRLVEQQHLRPGRERERDLEQPLLAVGELARRPVAARAEPQRLQDRIGLVDRVAIGRQPRHQVPASPRRSHTASVTASSALRWGNSVLIWNVRTSPRLTRCSRLERGDLVRAEEDLAAVRAQHAGHEVDQRGLAGAVRPDQRVARALRQGDRDVPGDDSEPKLLSRPRVDSARTALADSRLACTRTLPPASVAARARRGCRWAGTSRRRPAAVPIQKYQYCGLMPENWSRATM